MPYQKITLDNKVRVITVPMPQTRSVVAGFFAAAGSRYESEKLAGMSHFLEHMHFKGTKKRPTHEEISRAIEGVGGMMNAWTDNEATGYWVKVLPEQTELGLEVLSDMLVNSVFPENEIEKDKLVIAEEINKKDDQPEEKIFENFYALLYPNDALGRPVIGYKTTIKKFKREDFFNYKNSLYSGQNLVLAAAGKLPRNIKEMSSKYGRLFDNFKPSLNWSKVIERQQQPAVSLEFKKTEQAHLVLGVRTFDGDNPERFKLAVLNSVLGRGASSRLFLNIREKRGLAYAVGSSEEYHRDSGFWLVYAGLNLSKLEEAMKAILEEMARVKREFIPEKEFEEAKERLLGPLQFGLESNRGMLEFYAKQELLNKEVLTPEEVIKRIEKVSQEDLMALAKRYFVKETLNLAVIGPYKVKEEDKLANVLKL